MKDLRSGLGLTNLNFLEMADDKNELSQIEKDIENIVFCLCRVIEDLKTLKYRTENMSQLRILTSKEEKDLKRLDKVINKALEDIMEEFE